MNKYFNKKVIVDGIKFDSKKEANRFNELKLLKKAGIIKELELQKVFELQPKYINNKESISKNRVLSFAIVFRPSISM